MFSVCQICYKKTKIIINYHRQEDVMGTSSSTSQRDTVHKRGTVSTCKGGRNITRNMIGLFVYNLHIRPGNMCAPPQIYD